MEQLLMRADRLHGEAALLSNTLHEYRDDDVEGVQPVVEKILQTRHAWKGVRAQIQYFEKTGTLPEEKKTAASAGTNASEGTISELRLEIQRLNTNISKHKKKLEMTPDHKKAELWREDLAKMEAIKTEIRNKIIELTYATAQQIP